MSTMVSPCALTVLLATLASLPAAAAPLYKWTDSAGRVTYGSIAPRGVNAERVGVPPAPSADEVRDAQARLQRMQAQLAMLEEARRSREEAEAAARRRALPPAPARVIERPVYVPQAIYVPVLTPPLHHRPRPLPPHPRPDRDARRH